MKFIQRFFLLLGRFFYKLYQEIFTELAPSKQSLPEFTVEEAYTIDPYFKPEDLRRGVFIKSKRYGQRLQIMHVFRNVKKYNVEVKGVSTDLFAHRHFIDIKDIVYIYRPKFPLNGKKAR